MGVATGPAERGPISTVLVGPAADAATFFAGSVFFTLGGALQVWLAAADRREPAGPGRLDRRGRAVRRHAVFNVTTFRALQTTLSDPAHDRLVWRPDAFGSVCFLVFGVIAYRASQRHGWLPAPAGGG